jgi:hypothetical protein
MKYCTACGAPLKENAKFCPKCSALIKAKPIETGDKEAAETIPASETAAEKIEMPAREETVHSLPAEKNGHPYSRPDLMHYKVFLISVSFIVILAIVIGTLFSRGTMPSIRYSYLDEEKKPQITYEIIDTIWPSLYKQSDSIVNFTGTCSGGDTTVMVKAEVPGFSQVYEQQYTLGDQITEAYIKPPMLTGDLDLNSEKDSQIVFSITDQDTGKVLVKETKAIKIESEYDFLQVSGDIYGDYAFTDKTDTLAWITPEDESILKVKRAAID